MSTLRREGPTFDQVPPTDQEDPLHLLSIRELLVDLAEVESRLYETSIPGVGQARQLDDEQRRVLTAKAGRLSDEITRRREEPADDDNRGELRSEVR